MHFALCVAMLTVFLVTSECTATDADAQPVGTAPTAASVPDVDPGAVPGVVYGKKLSNLDGHDGDNENHDDEDNDEDNGHDDQGKKKKTGVGSNDPGAVGTNGHAASSKAGVVAPRIPAAGTDHRPDGSGVSPGDGRTGDPLSSPSSPDNSNGSGSSGIEKSGGLSSGSTVGGSTVGGSTAGGIGITGTVNKLNSTTTTKMADDDERNKNAIKTSTAPITTLTKPTKTVQPQPVENKNDGSSRKALLSAFPTLLTLTVMAVVPMY